MQVQPPVPSRAHRVVDGFILAEMLVLGAIIESAGAIRNALDDLGDQATDEGIGQHTLASLPYLLVRTADEAIEPWSSRLRLWREIDH